ncbi:MAG: hypothetical protein M0Q37_10570, partial [Sphaerochaeta sp.]|nr:hypothetical protein [Sphaerochaeta sp.]
QKVQHSKAVDRTGSGGVAEFHGLSIACLVPFVKEQLPIRPKNSMFAHIPLEVCIQDGTKEIQD